MSAWVFKTKRFQETLAQCATKLRQQIKNSELAEIEVALGQSDLKDFEQDFR